MVSYESDQLDIQEVPGNVLGHSKGIPSVVLLAKHKSKCDVVVKKYKLDQELTKVEDFGDDAEFIRQEVIRMKTLRHSNILPVLSSFVAGPNICLVMPRMTYGSVRRLLDQHWETGLPEHICARLLRDVANALVYLHSKAIMHRSVRCSHVLVSESGAKLSGLRYACSLYDPPAQGIRYDYPLHVVKTNLNWISPEMLQQVSAPSKKCHTNFW